MDSIKKQIPDRATSDPCLHVSFQAESGPGMHNHPGWAAERCGGGQNPTNNWIIIHSPLVELFQPTDTCLVKGFNPGLMEQDLAFVNKSVTMRLAMTHLGSSSASAAVLPWVVGMSGQGSMWAGLWIRASELEWVTRELG
ncbi:hypothetical protein An01g08265 [Aspergillus niger]|uniref:Uncharacterized protein n=2 Tax=Aspergillus niger TaxID=5061 RepID=A2Q9L3_ASPNC|nr:hypothetical protein An01g08265 [Aspergillus niger]CAK43919.1 hypothetical protein An01g08265 [Aspergillus niger]